MKRVRPLQVSMKRLHAAAEYLRSIGYDLELDTHDVPLTTFDMHDETGIKKRRTEQSGQEVALLAVRWFVSLLLCVYVFL